MDPYFSISQKKTLNLLGTGSLTEDNTSKRPSKLAQVFSRKKAPGITPGLLIILTY